MLNTINSIERIDTDNSDGFLSTLGGVKSLLSSFADMGLRGDPSKKIGALASTTPTAVNKLVNGIGFVQAVSWNKSKKLYHTVGGMLPTPDTACGSHKDDDVLSDTTTESFEKARNEGFEV